jgi:hypothetical protein
MITNFHLVFTDIRPGMKIVNLIVCLSYDQYWLWLWQVKEEVIIAEIPSFNIWR